MRRHEGLYGYETDPDESTRTIVSASAGERQTKALVESAHGGVIPVLALCFVSLSLDWLCWELSWDNACCSISTSLTHLCFLQ